MNMNDHCALCNECHYELDNISKQLQTLNACPRFHNRGVAYTVDFIDKDNKQVKGYSGTAEVDKELYLTIRPEMLVVKIRIMP